MTSCGKSCEKISGKVAGNLWGKLWERLFGSVRVVRFSGKVFGFARKCSVMVEKLWERFLNKLSIVSEKIMKIGVFHLSTIITTNIFKERRF